MSVVPDGLPLRVSAPTQPSRTSVVEDLPSEARGHVIGLKFDPDSVLASITPTEADAARREDTFNMLQGALAELPGRLVKVGSCAKGTDVPGSESDVDAAFFWHGYHNFDHDYLVRWMELELRDEFETIYAINGTEFVITRAALSDPDANRKNNPLHLAGEIRYFDYSDLTGMCSVTCRFDLLVGFACPLQEMKDRIVETPGPMRGQFSACLVEHHIALMRDTAPAVKQAVRLAKWWRQNVLRLTNPDVIVKSFLLELLVLHAAETSRPEVRQPLALFKKILTFFVEYQTLKITWSVIRRGNKHRVLDPLNPSNNVARTLKDWQAVAKVARLTLSALEFRMC